MVVLLQFVCVVAQYRVNPVRDSRTQTVQHRDDRTAVTVNRTSSLWSKKVAIDGGKDGGLGSPVLTCTSLLVGLWKCGTLWTWICSSFSLLCLFCRWHRFTYVTVETSQQEVLYICLHSYRTEGRLWNEVTAVLITDYLCWCTIHSQCWKKRLLR